MITIRNRKTGARISGVIDVKNGWSYEKNLKLDGVAIYYSVNNWVEVPQGVVILGSNEAFIQDKHLYLREHPSYCAVLPKGYWFSSETSIDLSEGIVRDIVNLTINRLEKLS